METQKIDIENLILRVGSKYKLANKDLKVLLGKIVAGDIRLNYKDRYINMDKKYKRICDEFKGVQKDRIIKILSGTANMEDRKMFFMNYFINIKFMIKRCFKNAEECRYQAIIYNEKSVKAKSRNKPSVSDKYMGIAKQYKYRYEIFMNYIKSAGEFLSIALPECEDLFTDHEIAQIFSCSFNKVKKARETYDLLKKENKISGGFLLNAILKFGIENRGDYKGRREGIKDCPAYEIPCLDAIIFANIDQILEIWN